MISWADFKELYPDGKVLSRDTGFSRDYGKNPYFGYDDISQAPFLFDGTTPDQLPPMARVLTVDLNHEAVAYPYDVLSQAGVINDSVGGQAIVVFWAEGTASALDTSSIPEGREVGAAVAYSRIVDDRTLTFEFADGKSWTSKREAYGTYLDWRFRVNWRECNSRQWFLLTTSGFRGRRFAPRRRYISRKSL